MTAPSSNRFDELPRITIQSETQPKSESPKQDIGNIALLLVLTGLACGFYSYFSRIPNRSGIDAVADSSMIGLAATTILPAMLPAIGTLVGLAAVIQRRGRVEGAVATFLGFPWFVAWLLFNR